MIKNIITVSVKMQRAALEKADADVLVVGVFSDGIKRNSCLAQLDTKLDSAIAKLKELGDFDGKAQKTSLIYTDGKIASERVLLVGLGKKSKANIDTARKAAANAANEIVKMKLKTAAFALAADWQSRAIDPKDLTQAIVEGIYFGSYRYDEFVTNEDNARVDSLQVQIVEPDAKRARKLLKSVETGSVIGQAQSYGRTIANRPGNIVYPAVLAAEAQKLAEKTKRLSCTIFDDKQLAQKKMGGILAVGLGSTHKPRLIVLKYTPPGKAAAKLKTIGLVGKAVTFDSGGISIKPSRGMHEMKLDKSGGVAVLAAMKAIAQLSPPVNVYGIIPSAENLLSATSYRPGDIVTTYSGKTVEVQNTDAEGRMVLCDGLAYAVEQKCSVVIDIATLTGACKVALGSHKAGLMGNNKGLIEQLKKASTKTGEPIWHLPSGEEYLEDMKSKIADLKNIGGMWGGACTAGAFLGAFAEDAKWAHIDMAPMDIFETATRFGSNGSSGFGVALLTAYVMANSK